MAKVNDLTGMVFGRLKVIERNGSNKRGRAMWLCECICKNKTKVTVVGNNLLTGNSISCGCYHDEELSKMHNDKNFTEKRVAGLKNALVTHGMSTTNFYRLWKGILERCSYKKHTNYKYYGGIGIKVCERWHNFENFKEDMYEKYLIHIEEFGKKQTSIDRIDVYGNYEPDNCRWVTNIEQANNKRKKENCYEN